MPCCQAPLPRATGQRGACSRVRQHVRQSASRAATKHARVSLGRPICSCSHVALDEPRGVPRPARARALARGVLCSESPFLMAPQADHVRPGRAPQQRQPPGDHGVALAKRALPGQRANYGQPGQFKASSPYKVRFWDRLRSLGSVRWQPRCCKRWTASFVRLLQPHKASTCPTQNRGQMHGPYELSSGRENTMAVTWVGSEWVGSTTDVERRRLTTQPAACTSRCTSAGSTPRTRTSPAPDRAYAASRLQSACAPRVAFCTFAPWLE